MFQCFRLLCLWPESRSVTAHSRNSSIWITLSRLQTLSPYRDKPFKSVENILLKSVENISFKSAENISFKWVENIPFKSVENISFKSVQNISFKSVENICKKSVIILVSSWFFLYAFQITLARKHPSLGLSMDHKPLHVLSGTNPEITN